MKQGPKRARGRALVVGDGQHVAVADAAHRDQDEVRGVDVDVPALVLVRQVGGGGVVRAVVVVVPCDGPRA